MTVFLIVHRSFPDRHVLQALEIIDPRRFVPGVGIYLAWPRRSLRTLSPAATAFRDWVVEEAQPTQASSAAVHGAAKRAPRRAL
ncbi:MAG: hypothetical protein WKH97_01585 [Casimicrobiaceae bacterium]